MAKQDTLELEGWFERHEPDAFQTLVERYSGMVFGTCRRVLGNATDAEDVAQECFESLARSQKPPVGYLGPWLHRVAVNKSLLRIRSERRRKTREEQYSEKRPEAVEATWDDIYQHVDEAIRALPDDLQGPIIAHYLEGRTHAAIADSLDTPRNTVTHRIHRGLALVQKSLSRSGITVASAGLSTLMGTRMAEAAPASLVSTLGKIALAGPQTATLQKEASKEGHTSLSIGQVAVNTRHALWLAPTLLALIIGVFSVVSKEKAPLPEESASVSPQQQEEFGPTEDPAISDQDQRFDAPGESLDETSLVQSSSIEASADALEDPPSEESRGARVFGRVVDMAGDAVA